MWGWVFECQSKLTEGEKDIESHNREICTVYIYIYIWRLHLTWWEDAPGQNLIKLPKFYSKDTQNLQPHKMWL